MYIELWDATGHRKELPLPVFEGSLSFFLTQITDLNYWPLIRCMKLVLWTCNILMFGYMFSPTRSMIIIHANCAKIFAAFDSWKKYDTIEWILNVYSVTFVKENIFLKNIFASFNIFMRLDYKAMYFFIVFTIFIEHKCISNLH